MIQVSEVLVDVGVKRVLLPILPCVLSFFELPPVELLTFVDELGTDSLSTYSTFETVTSRFDSRQLYDLYQTPYLERVHFNHLFPPTSFFTIQLPFSLVRIRHRSERRVLYTILDQRPQIPQASLALCKTNESRMDSEGEGEESGE